MYCLFPQNCNVFLFIHWLGRVCVCVCVCVPFVCRVNAYGFAYWVMQMRTNFIVSPKWSTLRLAGH
jgi:hypothetical protein